MIRNYQYMCVFYQFKEENVCLTHRETELLNKFHYAFRFFKKPVTLTQHQSQSLRKSYEASNKDVKQAPTVRPKKVNVILYLNRSGI